VWDVATAKEIAILSGHENTEDVVIKNLLVDAGAERVGRMVRVITITPPSV
jgi:hypothetical protein